jgi:hypothetical protein
VTEKEDKWDREMEERKVCDRKGRQKVLREERQKDDRMGHERSETKRVRDKKGVR